MMKTIGKVSYKIILLIMAFVILFLSCSYGLQDHNINQGDIFDQLPDDSMDVLVFGSSHGQYSFNPSYFNQMSGLNSYMFGSGCQNPSVTLASIKYTLQTQHPSFIILEVYTFLDGSLNSCYANEMVYVGANNLKGTYRIEALKGIDDVDPDSYLDYVFDIRMNHDKWKNYTFDDLKQIFAKKEIDSIGEFGYVYNSFKEDYTYTPIYLYDDAMAPISETNQKYLDEIIALCKENNIQLVAYLAGADLKDSDQQQGRYVLDYCQKQGALVANFIDNAQDIGWFINRDGDSAHNNVMGSFKTTYALYQLLSEQYTLKSHKYYNQLYLEYKGNSWAYVLDSVKHYDNIYYIIDMIDALNLDVIVYKNATKRTSIIPANSESLQHIGFNDDFSDNTHSYYGIIKDNKLVFDSYEYGSYEHVDFQIGKVIIDDIEIEIKDDFALILYDYSRHEYVIINADIANQDYFFRSECYEKACQFND